MPKLSVLLLFLIRFISHSPRCNDFACGKRFLYHSSVIIHLFIYVFLEGEHVHNSRGNTLYVGWKSLICENYTMWWKTKWPYEIINYYLLIYFIFWRQAGSYDIPDIFKYIITANLEKFMQKLIRVWNKKIMQ